MEINFTGKRALVTGAGRGIGREVVRLLVQCGCTSVVAVSRTQANLDSLKLEFPSIETVTLELGDWNRTKRVLAPYAESIDLLVNNAADAECAPLEEVTEKSLDRLYNLNVKELVNVTQIVVGGMKKRRYGSIVNVSSLASLVGVADHLAYGATKGALDVITKVLTIELAPFNIRVNSVNPSVTWTEMAMVFWADKVKQEKMLSKVPLGRFGQPVEVAQCIAFLLSDRASMLNGVLLPIDGGLFSTSSPA